MGRIRGRIRVSEGIRTLKKVEALLLPAFNLLTGPWKLANLICSSVRLAERLL